MAALLVALASCDASKSDPSDLKGVFDRAASAVALVERRAAAFEGGSGGLRVGRSGPLAGTPAGEGTVRGQRR